MSWPEFNQGTPRTVVDNCMDLVRFSGSNSPWSGFQFPILGAKRFHYSYCPTVQLAPNHDFVAAFTKLKWETQSRSQNLKGLRHMSAVHKAKSEIRNWFFKGWPFSRKKETLFRSFKTLVKFRFPSIFNGCPVGTLKPKYFLSIFSFFGGGPFFFARNFFIFESRQNFYFKTFQIKIKKGLKK